MSVCAAAGEAVLLRATPPDDEAAPVDVNHFQPGGSTSHVDPLACASLTKGQDTGIGSPPPSPDPWSQGLPGWSGTDVPSEWRRSSGKRTRLGPYPGQHSGSEAGREQPPPGPSSTPSSHTLLGMPRDLLVSNLLSRVDGASLARLEVTCRGLSQLVEDAARTACLQGCNSQKPPPRMHSNLCWKQRLHLQDSIVGFQLDRPENGVFKLGSSVDPGSHAISLQGMGPKLLVSDISTADQRTLRWCIAVEGNKAIEFGVVPLVQQDSPISLHKAQKEALPGGVRAVGFASDSTFGSELGQQILVFRGTIVDIVAQQGRVDYRIWHPDDAKLVRRKDSCNCCLVPYNGPKLLEVSYSFPDHYPVKLACTMWARCSIRLLQPLCQK